MKFDLTIYDDNGDLICVFVHSKGCLFLRTVTDVEIPCSIEYALENLCSYIRDEVIASIVLDDE